MDGVAVHVFSLKFYGDNYDSRVTSKSKGRFYFVPYFSSPISRALVGHIFKDPLFAAGVENAAQLLFLCFRCAVHVVKTNFQISFWWAKLTTCCYRDWWREKSNFAFHVCQYELIFMLRSDFRGICTTDIDCVKINNDVFRAINDKVTTLALPLSSIGGCFCWSTAKSWSPGLKRSRMLKSRQYQTLRPTFLRTLQLKCFSWFYSRNFNGATIAATAFRALGLYPEKSLCRRSNPGRWLRS